MNSPAPESTTVGMPVQAILGTVVNGPVAVLSAVFLALVSRGVKVGDPVKPAADKVGGGGSRSDTTGKRPKGTAATFDTT